MPSDLEASASFQMPSIDFSGMLKNKFSMLNGLLGSLGSMMGGGKSGGGGSCKPKCGRGRMMKMSVMPGLGDKHVEREVKKYMGEHELAMLLMKAVASSGGGGGGGGGKCLLTHFFCATII